MTDRKITLGGKDYPFKPLTLGQMKAVGIGSAKKTRKVTDPSAEEGNWYDGTFEIIAAGTGMTLDQVTKLEGVKLNELIDASRTILDECGLIKVTAGTAEAGAMGEAPGTAG